MAGRTIVVDGAPWRVLTSGRVTVYGRDQFGLVFEQGTGPERRRRFTRYSPVGNRSPDAALAELPDREVVRLFHESQPAWTARRENTARVDLHCHSTASDGEYPPAEVARLARVAGLAAIALTDHDTTDGVPEATRAGEALGLRVVSGAEFSVRAPWGELHVLGYFLPPGSARLEEFLTGTRAARRRRAEQIVAHLQRLGIDVELADVERAADGGALGRPHVARVLIERGVSADMNEAFARYLGRGRPAYVEKPLPTLQQVTALVHDVGGIAVAAHLGDHGTEGQIRQFQVQGLDGLEVRHPSHSAGTERRLTAIADRLGLGISGGSDWHGDAELGESHAALGGLDVPMAWLEQLEQRRAAVLREPVTQDREGQP